MIRYSFGKQANGTMLSTQNREIYDRIQYTYNFTIANIILNAQEELNPKKAFH